MLTCNTLLKHTLKRLHDFSLWHKRPGENTKEERRVIYSRLLVGEFGEEGWGGMDGAMEVRGLSCERRQ